MNDVFIVFLLVDELQTGKRLPQVWHEIEEHKVHRVVGRRSRAYVPKVLQVRVSGARFWSGLKKQGVALDATFLFRTSLKSHRPSRFARGLDFSSTCGDTCS